MGKKKAARRNVQTSSAMFIDRASNVESEGEPFALALGSATTLEQTSQVDSMGKKESAKRNMQTSSAVFIDRASDVESEDEISNNEAPLALTPHPEFFFDDTLVAIQVERILFNVHKYQLSKSKVFSDSFKESKAKGTEPEEGSSPECPIILRGVSASDFAALLRVLYASHFSYNPPTPEADLVVPAFRLAYVFNFSELHAFLLPLAEKNLNDVDKIAFSREFDIEEWLVPSHVRLCKREKPLTTQEGMKLGVESVLIISRMRELHRSRPSFPSSIVDKTYCDSCMGLTFIDGFPNCDGCGSNGPASRINGTGKIAQGGAPMTNDAAIEEGVRKWVEDGGTLKD